MTPCIASWLAMMAAAMCGINGIWQRSSNAAAIDSISSAVQQMNAVLSHRGPDENGIYSDGPLTLGHVRLSILDLAAGQQPWLSSQRRVAVVFNGEIYNYHALRAEFEGEGVRFTTHCDTEIIPHCYAKYGDDFARHLNGMFAIALWDIERQRLLLTRDRLGKKPLYYARSGEGVIFSSEIQALLASGRVDKQLSLEALDSYLALGYVPTNQCVFSAVEKLPPASYLSIDNSGQCRSGSYWQLDTRVPDQVIDEAEALQQLDATLSQAVKQRLFSDVPLGCFLSGGIDSSLIASYVAENSAAAIDSYCIGFNEAAYDERASAKAVADYLGTRHHEEVVEVDSLSTLPMLQRHFGEPFADASAIPTYALCRGVSEDLTVAISGDGGDELFLGYSAYFRLLRRQQLSSLTGSFLLRPLLSAAVNLLPRNLNSALYRGLNTLVESSYPLAQQLALLRVKFNQSERQQLFREDIVSRHTAGDSVQQRIDALCQPLAHLDPIAQAARVDQRLYMADDILVKVDITSMASSLEVRSPLLDYRVAELAASFPRSLHFSQGQGKRLLKKLARDRLPAEILQKPKQGFGVPVSDWLRGEMAQYSRDLLLAEDNIIASVFDRSVVADLLLAHQSGRRDHGQKLWLLLCLAVWGNEYGLDARSQWR